VQALLLVHAHGLTRSTARRSSGFLDVPDWQHYGSVYSSANVLLRGSGDGHGEGCAGQAAGAGGATARDHGRGGELFAERATRHHTPRSRRPPAISEGTIYKHFAASRIPLRFLGDTAWTCWPPMARRRRGRLTVLRTLIGRPLCLWEHHDLVRAVFGEALHNPDLAAGSRRQSPVRRSGLRRLHRRAWPTAPSPDEHGHRRPHAHRQPVRALPAVETSSARPLPA